MRKLYHGIMREGHWRAFQATLALHSAANRRGFYIRPLIKAVRYFCDAAQEHAWMSR